ncbi:AbrB/MazE/SpoVT family DNA-binding domain-containing protein [Paracoccus sp. YLB-12]|uniref:AbrB/MazE/SpoVT family DNA-binding domain-containing protein n=1 Tax=Paracoccus maritimus TaxID=2933292 RepID=A0ABT2KEL3_9RHOB|nr:AbrB/MazE/SpoVT family DNA-binding domain-containing protein [Paracoccus sp. YLB-12]MCT4334280.1 AbrB/MazE/SpoVT family DNA-binding domain-containing protein [Paracoccus sp. YLB-12]
MPQPLPVSQLREAKLFRNNESQPVRTSAGFNMPVDPEKIYCDGDRILIGPVHRETLLEVLLGARTAWPRGSASWRGRDASPAQENQTLSLYLLDINFVFNLLAR